MSDQDDQLSFDLAKGRQQRDEGMARALKHTNDQVKKRASEIIEEIAKTKAAFNADDVNAWLAAEGLELDNPNGMGGIFAAASRKGLIARVGSRQTEQASQHAHTHPLWAGQ